MRRTRRRWKIAGVVLAVAMVYPSVTYVQALTYPGAASFTARTTDWLRSMGAGPVVNAAENWWYTRHAPANTPPDSTALPQRTAHAPSPAAQAGPSNLRVTAPVAGEGVWVAGAHAPDGTVASYTTFVRPDPRHASVVAGVALLDQNVTATHLVAGTKEPGGSGWPEQAQVPQSWRPTLLATFNSGFKFADTAGGFYSDGRFAKSLKDGMASLVIDRGGRVSVAEWGRDATMTPDVAAVRQNLHLVVDNGRPAPELTSNPAGLWGSASNQFQFTWRSGVGTDQAGHLVYVGGDHLTLSTLAAAMAQAGIIRGMELDIHSGMVAFNTYRPDLPGARPVKLLPTMPAPADRYLRADQRDFFAVTLRPSPQSNPLSRQHS
ncbi:MAG: hypothetical protein JWQ81_825 [Amycolatopsis sp.]|uniref:phosphodiester glycosidase family protein n=1 Tax=Amycolatopsis sp. TaxID=37632 RepID=UPI002625056D|nr:phosphodiester glycosidase family protein [Amycolatopsis sp.]MCU1680086.1 hypothetical protein [Amycolatopsis sp.]